MDMVIFQALLCQALSSKLLNSPDTQCRDARLLNFSYHSSLPMSRTRIRPRLK